MIVTEPREKLWAFINSRIATPWSEDFRAIGKVRNDCLCAVVAYNGFTGRSCFMHYACDDPTAVDRKFLRVVLDYPFRQLGYGRILALIDSENHHSLDISKRIGCREVHRFPDSGVKGDLVLLELKAGESRYG